MHVSLREAPRVYRCPQKPEDDIVPLELELEVVVSHSSGSSRRKATTLSCLDISPAPKTNFNFYSHVCTYVHICA